MRWQPIETAPKDGTLIQIWVEPLQPELTVARPATGVALKNNVFGTYAHELVGFWDARRFDAWADTYKEANCERPDWIGWSVANSKYRPTHWMPLPAPPEDTPNAD